MTAQINESFVWKNVPPTPPRIPHNFHYSSTRKFVRAVLQSSERNFLNFRSISNWRRSDKCLKDKNAKAMSEIELLFTPLHCSIGDHIHKSNDPILFRSLRRTNAKMIRLFWFSFNVSSIGKLFPFTEHCCCWHDASISCLSRSLCRLFLMRGDVANVLTQLIRKRVNCSSAGSSCYTRRLRLSHVSEIKSTV